MLVICKYLIFNCYIFEISFVVHKGVLIFSNLCIYFAKCISKYPCAQIQKQIAIRAITV